MDRSFRNQDLICRYGGEEFAVAINGVDITTVTVPVTRGDETLAGISTEGGDIEITNLSGEISISEIVSTLGGDIVFTTDSVAVAADITAWSGFDPDDPRGTLLLQPLSVDRSIGIADGAPGGFNLSSAELDLPAKRPAYSVLDTHKLETALGKPLPTVLEGIERYLSLEE